MKVGVNVTLRPLYPQERPGTHCIGVWVGSRADLNWSGKSRPSGFDPWTVQPVASRYTDYSTNEIHVWSIGRMIVTVYN
jgi:hypothetical protein